MVWYQGKRIHKSPIFLVSADLWQLFLFNTTCRRDTILRACTLWRHLYWSGRSKNLQSPLSCSIMFLIYSLTGMYTASRSPALLSGLVTFYFTDRSFEWYYGLRSAASILPPCGRLSTKVWSQMVIALYHDYVFYWATVPQCHVERLQQPESQNRRACPNTASARPGWSSSGPLCSF